MSLLSEVARLLLAITPKERSRRLAEETVEYATDISQLLDNPPFS